MWNIGKSWGFFYYSSLIEDHWNKHSISLMLIRFVRDGIWVWVSFHRRQQEESRKVQQKKRTFIVEKKENWIINQTMNNSKKAKFLFRVFLNNFSFFVIARIYKNARKKRWSMNNFMLWNMKTASCSYPAMNDNENDFKASPPAEL